MTQEERARENWKELYRQHGKGSSEEMAAYQEYVRITQGIKPPSKIRTIREKQPDLAGLSEAETFTLNNPVTEISRPLARQERITTLNLF